MPSLPSPSVRVLAASILLLAPLAGCIGSDEPASADTQDPPKTTLKPAFASFDAAMSASGETFSPDQNTTHALKLLSPTDTGDVEVAKQNITLALYDTEQMAPIEDANVTLDAIMSAMGHGTSPEEDPVHTAHGLYQGMTNLMMDGVWRLDLGATLADGTELTWSIEIKVGDVGGTHPNAKTVHHRYTDTFNETVVGADHSKNWTFPVNETGASVHLNLSLVEPKPIDELNVALISAAGDELVSATLTSDAPAATLNAASTPDNGTYTLEVTGRALDTAYTAGLDVVWTTLETPKTDGDGHGGHGGHSH